MEKYVYQGEKNQIPYIGIHIRQISLHFPHNISGQVDVYHAQNTHYWKMKSKNYALLLVYCYKKISLVILIFEMHILQVVELFDKMLLFENFSNIVLTTLLVIPVKKNTYEACFFQAIVSDLLYTQTIKIHFLVYMMQEGRYI